MNLNFLIVLVLVLLLVGALPTWPYSAQWGHAPSGMVGIILLVVIVLWLTGRF